MELFFAQLPLVVSYYTKNTPYEEEAKNLIASCKQWNVEHHIEGVDDLGSWENNCFFKPCFIRNQLLKWKRPILWVDSDAIFLRPFIFDEFMFADLGVLKYEGQEDPRLSLMSGTVYINATPGGKQGVDLWCFYAEKIHQAKGTALPFADQMSLNLTVLSGAPLKIAPLPLRYCAIFDQDKGEEVDSIIIEHGQASRKWR